MWNKTSAVGSGSSSAANSQPNLQAPHEMNNHSGNDSIRKKLFDDDTYHMESIVNLEKECQQALAKILLDPLSQNAVNVEQQLWNCFIKQYKVHLVCLLDIT